VHEYKQMMQSHGTMSEPDLRLTCVQTMQRYMKQHKAPGIQVHTHAG